MKLLSLDTCSLYGSLALTDGERLVAELTTLGALNRNEQLFPLLEQLLSLVGWTFQSLDGFVVSRGPGAFTGLRIGIATVQGLSLATGKPAWGMNSLLAHAWGLPHTRLPICPVMDARKQEVYTALYQWQDGKLHTLLPTQVVSADVFARHIASPVMLVGDGAELMAQAIERRRAETGAAGLSPETPAGIRLAGSAGNLRASAMATWAWELIRTGQESLLEPATPLYLRASEAELKLGPTVPVVPLSALEQPEKATLSSADETSAAPAPQPEPHPGSAEAASQGKSS